MSFYHYQCQHCLCSTYFYDDGEDDGIEILDAFDDCGCMDEVNAQAEFDYYDDDD